MINNTDEIINNEEQTQRTYKVYLRIAPDYRVYVGCTSRSLEERAGNNGCEYKSQPEFYKAIQELGWSNFKSAILFETTDLNEAHFAEKYYIHCFDSTNPEHGFNKSNAGYITDPTYIDRITEINRMHNSDPEIVAKIKATCKAIWDDPQKRKEHGEMIREILSDSEIRAKISEHTKAGIAKEAPGIRSERSKRNWEDPAIREKAMKAMKIACNTPEHRKKQSDTQQIIQNLPEQKEIRSKHFTGLLFINNGVKSIRVSKEEGDKLVATGEWVWGRRATGPRGHVEKLNNRKWVHTLAGDAKFVPEAEVADYLAQGWILGRGKLK